MERLETFRIGEVDSRSGQARKVAAEVKSQMDICPEAIVSPQKKLSVRERDQAVVLYVKPFVFTAPVFIFRLILS